MQNVQQCSEGALEMEDHLGRAQGCKACVLSSTRCSHIDEMAIVTMMDKLQCSRSFASRTMNKFNRRRLDAEEKARREGNVAISLKSELERFRKHLEENVRLRFAATRRDRVTAKHFMLLDHLIFISAAGYEAKEREIAMLRGELARVTEIVKYSACNAAKPPHETVSELQAILREETDDDRIYVGWTYQGVMGHGTTY
ncbi:hypothetical protein CC1G_09776 [Coprinopsis cinerea okayama7|uniref:Uncharacterized protein n=1 Tax=Coprinopsis cinerea (strain Okayama-7 / 130 / ATCC MYA-4618 / FGSC 9003) TaxID=240176 RepID=A8PE45_COPC7|nr:hypothetical protein CC1G_09776 [Coprinopsis cinerea okayama7\|eukprot:XP_001840725.2 hypothetical protein CC1G_09776 [Coprinopsis cinerea okayama7\